MSAYHEVGILSTWHLVIEDTRVGSPDVGLKAAVQHTNLTPVQV